MSSYVNYIDRFIVRVMYLEKNCGSGVLFKVDSDTCYLITAKHNFKINGEVKISELNNNIKSIVINNDEEENIICEVDEIIYEDVKYDILIFSVIEKSTYIQNIEKISPVINENPPLKIALNYSSSIKDYYLFGYPCDTDGTPIGTFNHFGNIRKKGKEHLFRLKLSNGENINDEDLDGLSGSGIFIKYDEKYYLVGIFIWTRENYNLYQVIDFSKIIMDLEKDIKLQCRDIEEKITSPKKIFIDMLKNSHELLFRIQKNSHNSKLKNHAFNSSYSMEKIMLEIEKMDISDIQKLLQK